MKYRYQSEKFSAARRSLMLPHPQGEALSIVGAFRNCSLALRELNKEELDDNVKDWISTLERIMDTPDIEDTTGRGTWLIKAEQLTEDQKLELSRVIDELAHWFNYDT